LGENSEIDRFKPPPTKRTKPLLLPFSGHNNFGILPFLNQRHRMSRILLAILFTLFAAVPGTLARVGTAHYHGSASHHARSQFAGRVERSRKVRKAHHKRKLKAVEGLANKDTRNLKIVDRVPSTLLWDNAGMTENASTRVVDGKKQKEGL
jgi:hypothetical protein